MSIAWRRPWPLALAGLAAAALLLLWGLREPAPVLQGWLIAFAFWSGVAIGGLVLLLIHALTGGRWGEAIAPVLEPAVRTLPLFVLLFVPLALGLRHLYPWAVDPSVTSPSVARLYLNPPAFWARSAIALVGWAVLSFPVFRRRPLLAGLGLAFHGLAISLVAVDWLLSLDPSFTSSDFAAGVAIGQLLTALAWAALLRSPNAAPEPTADLAGLLLACLLGTFYLGYMQYVVSWYGNLPEKAAWYLHRTQGLWGWLGLASLAFAVILPFLALLFRAVRRDPDRLRWVGAAILLGVLLRTVWLVAPSPSASLATVLALVAIGGAWIGLAHGVRPLLARAEVIHGA